MARKDDARPERELTDKSLAGERGKTDRELEKRATHLQEDADEVVATARERADHVLTDARATADEKLREAGATSGMQASIETERAREDEALARERSTADEKLASERIERRRAIAALLTLEREQTDFHLLGERGRADEAIASRDDFLAIVSHDLRNMLGIIAMSAASLLRIRADEPVRGEIDREAQRIQRHTARMSRLVGDLLDVVSIDAGRLRVVPQRHEATELLRETQDVFRPIAASKGISMRTEVHPGAHLALYDQERIFQVLANLVGNAIKFTPRGGRVDMVVEPVDDEVRFAVTDTGPGIAPEQLGVIFDRFWQNASKDGSGLGLGLYISKCIVEAHRGRIWAESRLGSGSTFYFTLPAATS